MSGMYGADVAQLRQLATQFDRFAADLDASRMTVGNAIRISAWVGPFAVRFRHEWDSSHSRRVQSAATTLRDAAQRLRANADDQERASAVDGGASGGGGSSPGFSVRPENWPWHNFLPQLEPRPNWPDFIEFVLKDVVIDGTDWVSTHVDAAGLFVDHIAKTKGFDFWEVVPNGSYISSVIKGIGLGDAAARLAQAVEDRDLAGGMLAATDGVASFVPNPVSIVWGGLTGMTGFFIPLDQESRDEHMAWAEGRYSDSELAERYTGVQGFVNLGNDNVERKAAWINRAAETALQGPAEWLYNAGIKLY